MALSMVRRRVAGYTKARPKHRPRAPQREPRDDEQMVGEQARPAAPMSAMGARRAPSRSSPWQKAAKPATVAAGILLFCGIAFVALKDTVRFASGYRAAGESSHAAASSGAGLSSRRGGQSSEYPRGSADTVEVVLSNRSAPTDESFLAAGYARKKAVLPAAADSGVSGECVVKGGGVADINECLRQQGRR